VAPASTYEASGEVSCDGRDNDCDGAVDESCPRCVFTPGAMSAEPKGVCTFGIAQESGACGEPAAYDADEDGSRDPALCDGLDNDCDGAADEGCPCTFARSLFGVCAEARRDADGVCARPTTFALLENATNDPSICSDGLDNDCDGVADCRDPGCPRDRCGSNLTAEFMIITSSRLVLPSTNATLDLIRTCEELVMPQAAIPLVSDGSNDLRDRVIDFIKPMMLRDSTRIVNNAPAPQLIALRFADLFESTSGTIPTLLAAPNYDEAGVEASGRVWTGTTAAFEAASMDCFSDGSADRATHGTNDAVSTDWLDAGTSPCTDRLPVYCPVDLRAP